VLYFAVHDSEKESSANTVIIHLKPQLRLRQLSRKFHFADLAVKSRGAVGNIITKHGVDRVVRASKDSGGSSDLELI